MRNPERWRETKFVKTGNRWTASRDPRQVSLGSRLMGDMLAHHYSAAIAANARGALLDHGCGQSPLYGMYGPLADEVIAVDWGASAHATVHADAFMDLNEPMSFPDARFDTIVSSDVIEHLWNPVAVFADLARVLRPGGRLIVGTPFNYWLHEVPHDYFRWSRYAIAKVGAQAGMRLIDLRRIGGTRDVLADVAMKALPGRLRRLTPVVDRAFRAIGAGRLQQPEEGAFSLATVAVLERS